MRTSKQGLAFIARHEGIVTRAYRDVAGVWTIGIGHTAAAGPPKPRAGMTITRAEAHAILARDLPRYETRVAAALGPVSQTVFDAAISFDFNTGAIHRASWVRAYRAGNRTGARVALMKWNRAGGRIVQGLVRRREAEARLLFEGDYGAGAAPAVPAASVRAYQEQLAALGFDVGPIDGIAGPRTRAAVLAYQRSRPDLVDDGIVGPATRASLSRAVASAAGKTGAGTAVAGTVGATAAVAATGGDPLLPLAWGLGIVLLVAVGFAVYTYRGPIRRFFSPAKG